YIDMHKYAIVPVFKGCSLVTFNIISKSTFVRVLRAHDIAQIVTCSLSSACKMFLDPSDPEASKIDYHYEIMDISAKRYKEWRNWTLEDMKRPITIQVFENDPDYAIVDESIELSTACARYTHAREITYVPYDVIAYCMRDTDVLPKLYSAINQMNRADCGLPIWQFLTIGALTFYCGMVHAKPMIVKKSEKHISEHCTEWKGHKTELYPLDIEQEHFTRPAIFGGRACPRVLSDSEPCVYADVSGMYTSILVRAHLPYGDITWIAPRDACARVERLKDFALTLTKYAVDHGIHPIQCMQLRAPDYFICDCEFTEYSGLLEPVLPARDAMHRTIFTVEKRQATITSVDMLTILLMGGTIHNVGRMLHFAKGAPYAREWATICQDGKVKYKKSNRGLSQLYKLKGNGFYGQLMRKDHTDQFTIVSREDQTLDFLRDHDWRYFLELDGDQDILYGSARDDVASFMTTRPTYAGAFVLAYSRVMIMQIINLVNPMNRLELQPRLGDTDSLLIPLSRIEALQSFRIDNDIMIEELSNIWNAVTARIHNESFVYVGEGVVPEGDYECTGWFPMPYIDTDGKIIKLRARTGQLTDECMDTITDHGLHDRSKQKEYDDNTKFAIVERVFSPAPKVLACVFRDPISGRLCSKYRCKGVSSTAQVGDSMYSSTLISAGELFAYEDAGEHNAIRATMPDKLKKVGPGCVRASDRADAGVHLLTIHSYDLVRKILSKDWEGRKRVRCQYTAPYGWIDPNQ
ncbi:MAG: DNA polymerase, partial [Candidatus Paceibacterota bacterium]